MSDQNPFTPGEPEYLGGPAPFEDEQAPKRSGRRWGVVGGAAAGVVLVAGVGGWGVAQLLAGGESPAAAVPADAVGYVSIDLDPSAGQKIEALRTMRKFPALAKELDLGSRDDVRRWVFEQMQDDGTCKELDYSKDVEPWLGNRVALAAVPDDKDALVPLAVVQVTDTEAARAGVGKLDACSASLQHEMKATAEGGVAVQGKDERTPTGVAFVGDYMLVAEHQADADRFAKDAESASLADDQAFQEWTGRVGDSGIITAYAAADLPRLAMKQITGMNEAETEAEFGSGSFGDTPEKVAERWSEMWKDFHGAAAVVRFGSGSVEAEAVGDGLPKSLGTTGDTTAPSLGALPASTAVAVSTSLKPGWLTDYLDGMTGLMGPGMGSPEDMWKEMERGTGLNLPEDIETMLGDGLSISVDASADFEHMADSAEVPQAPLGLRISGDPAEITRVIDKIKALAGPDADAVHVVSGDGVVAVALSEEYATTLLADNGGLGDTESFRSAVPEADRATGAIYVNFDAGDGWVDRLASSDKEAAANLKPLDALGISSWTEDGVQHGLLKLTTD